MLSEGILLKEWLRKKSLISYNNLLLPLFKHRWHILKHQVIPLKRRSKASYQNYLEVAKRIRKKKRNVKKLN